MSYIIIAAFSSWFAVFSGVPQYLSGVLFNFGLKKYYTGSFIPYRLKPFDCDKCLSFWLACVYACFHWEGPMTLLLPGITSLFSIVTTRSVNLLK